MSIILVVFLLVSFGDFPGSLVAVKSGQRQGNGSAQTINKSSREESGFKMNTKLQSYFLIMLFPICFVSQKVYFV